MIVGEGKTDLFLAMVMIWAMSVEIMYISVVSLSNPEHTGHTLE